MTANEAEKTTRHKQAVINKKSCTPGDPANIPACKKAKRQRKQPLYIAVP